MEKAQFCDKIYGFTPCGFEKMLSWLSEIFKDPDNRAALSWLGGGIVVVAGGIWAVFKFFAARKGPPKSGLIERPKRTFETMVGKMPILAILDSRFINKSRTDIKAVDDEYRDIREYAAYHFLYEKPHEPIIQNFLYQICIDCLKSKPGPRLSISPTCCNTPESESSYG